MNLHGYSSTHDVIEHACSLHHLGRLVCESGRWWWSSHKADPRFVGTLARPFDSVLRAEGITPEILREKFAARELIC